MDIYGEILLDHFKNPRHLGLLKDGNILAEDLNPMCGDKVTVSLKVDDHGIIQNFGFLGNGCAISVASISLFGDKIIGQKLDDILQMSGEEAIKLLEIPISPGRVKCALLGFSCIKKAATLHKSKNN